VTSYQHRAVGLQDRVSGIDEDARQRVPRDATGAERRIDRAVRVVLEQRNLRGTEEVVEACDDHEAAVWAEQNLEGPFGEDVLGTEIGGHDASRAEAGVERSVGVEPGDAQRAFVGTGGQHLTVWLNGNRSHGRPRRRRDGRYTADSEQWVKITSGGDQPYERTERQGHDDGDSGAHDWGDAGKADDSAHENGYLQWRLM
jgi:hypothetical protein